MKNFISKTKYVLMALSIIMFISCNGEDGEMGPPGANGLNGLDGQDGNANVIMKTVDADPGPFLNWTASFYLGKTSNLYEINDTDIDQNVMDSALILVYFQLFQEDVWYPMLFNFVFSGGGNEQVFTFTYELNKLNIYAFDSNGGINGAINKVRYFIIESTNKSSSKASSINALLQLRAAGVDINNYYQVVNHFGLEY